MQENEIPRRIDIRRNAPAELAIRAAIDAVEMAGCHPLLTDAVILLQQAREKVADFVDLELTRQIDSKCGNCFGTGLLGDGETPDPICSGTGYEEKL